MQQKENSNSIINCSKRKAHAQRAPAGAWKERASALFTKQQSSIYAISG
jgi:hypothetical protein